MSEKDFPQVSSEILFDHFSGFSAGRVLAFKMHSMYKILSIFKSHGNARVKLPFVAADMRTLSVFR